MKIYTIGIQNGLDEIRNLLLKEGYNVCIIGDCGSEKDILIISGVNSEYEGIQPVECRTYTTEKNLLVINASEFTPKEIVELVKNNKCN